jgi:glycine oxidase
VTLDGFPLIGRLPLPGLYLMTGTYRDGFHCAPVLAAHVANELQGRPGIIDPMFAPVRAPIATRTREWSVEEFVQHNLATWFETGAQATPQMAAPQLAAMYRGRGVQAYEELGIDYALGPDVLLYAAGSPSGAERISRYLRRYEGPAAAASPPPVAAAVSADGRR